MKTAAVICEYNPMHDGHRAMLAQIRARIGADGAILCLMSGDYVQRGEPAVFDKYTRAATAVTGGADLVLELPYPWSSAVSEHFAGGALSILRDLAVVDGVFFGSEGKSVEELSTVALRQTDGAYRQRLTAARGEYKTLSYPRLCDKVYKELYGEEPSLLPNEILGVEYLKSARRLGLNLPFEALPMNDGFSASQLRLVLRAQRQGAALEIAERAILFHLLLAGKNDRFSRASARCATLGELFSRVRTPSDTDARLRRELLGVLFGGAGKEKEAPRFTVLLAANDRGKALLRAIKKNGGIEVVTKQAHAPENDAARGQYRLYQRAQSLYPSFSPEGGSGAAMTGKKPHIV